MHWEKLGDEFNYMLEFTNVEIKILGSKYIQKFYYCKPIMYKFSLSMQGLSQKPKLYRPISKFVKDIMHMVN